MKKCLLFVLLASSLTSLVGCQKSDSIKRISIKGSLTKKVYKYDDSWDLSGLSVYADFESGSSRALESNEYDLHFNAEAPKNFATALSITAVYKKDTSKSATFAAKDIKVADEVYDEKKEINSYYSDCDLDASNLLSELQRHSFAKHKTFVKYSDTQAYMSKGKGFESCDYIPGEHKIEMFYTGNKTAYNPGSREHVWPCADSAGLWPHPVVDDKGYAGGGSDLYHVRPSTNAVNTARGDAPYVDFDDSEFSSARPYVVEVGDEGPYKLKLYGADPVGSGKYEFADLVEPADEFKGDIARIIAYVYMHYKTNSKYSKYTGSLSLTKVIGYSTQARAIEKLKEWNELDPASDVEKFRNHEVQKIQGNRNPFVDFPDLMDEAF